MTTDVTPKGLCRKKRKLVGASVCIEPFIYGLENLDAEKRRAELERWVNEFRRFLEDHSNLDVDKIYVEPTHEVVCSECGNEWEEFLIEGYELEKDEEPYVGCIHCGTPVEIAT